MITPEQAKKQAELLESGASELRLFDSNQSNIYYIAALTIRDLANQVEALQADARRYRWMKENAIDSHMWNDESIDAAMEAENGQQKEI